MWKRIAVALAQLACGLLTRGRHVPVDDPILGKHCAKCLKKL